MGGMPQQDQEGGSKNWAFRRLSMEEEEEAGSQESTPEGGSSVVRIKRKRGRPRKYPRADGFDPLQTDRNRNHRQAASPSLSSAFDQLNDESNLMIGQVVHGTLDAAFDAGYLLTVQVGNSETTLRGVVFKPGNFIPVSPANDIAPGLAMIRRRELPSGGDQAEPTLPKSNANHAASIIRTPPPASFSNNHGASVDNTQPFQRQDSQAVAAMPWETQAETSCHWNRSAAPAPPFEPNSTTIRDLGSRVDDSAISVQDYAGHSNKVLSMEFFGATVQLDLGDDHTTCRTGDEATEFFQEKEMGHPDELAEDQVGPDEL